MREVEVKLVESKSCGLKHNTDRLHASAFSASASAAAGAKKREEKKRNTFRGFD